MLVVAGVVLPLLAAVSGPPLASPQPVQLLVQVRPAVVFGAAPVMAPVQQTPPPPGSMPVDCRHVKCVALTFDDGPVKQTAKVLDVLKSRGARATFFVVGVQAQAYPALLRRMVAEGDAVGNHSWNHPIFSGKSAAFVRKQLTRTDSVITAAIGPHQRLVRTPFGQVNKKIRTVVAHFGAPLIEWSVDPRDWKDRKTKTVVARVMKAARPNSIVLIHDIRPTTRAAVPAIVDRLQAKGYVLVTVPELLGSRDKPGTIHRHG
jgi:peptidoglycan/xylan/chitin deacetylase (PgdA/CDA1 family)